VLVDTFIPFEPEPLQVVQLRLFAGLHVPCLVGVLDAYDEIPVVVSRKQVVEQRGACIADVQVPRGAGCLSYSDFIHYDSSIFSSRTTASLALPSPLPVNLSFSVVVAFIFYLHVLVFNRQASIYRI